MKENCRFTIRYKFSGSIADLEFWLNDNCKGAFWFELADVHETDSPFGQLDVLFHFEHDEDRQVFKEQAKTGPKW